MTVVVAQILGRLIGVDSSSGKSGSHGWRLFWLSPLRFIVDGAACVILFFVLRGFVLALPYCDGRSPNYRLYLLGRFCRIYLPYIVAVAVAIFSKSWLYRGPVDWVDSCQEWSKPTSWSSIFHHALLVTNSGDQRFDPVTWSLTHEMRLSIVFPLIMAMIFRIRAWKALVLSLALSVIGFSGQGL